MTDLLECRDLTFGYGRGEALIDGLSWKFPAGQMTGITGASGSGKSTLLYLLGLMTSPRSGEVLVASRSTANLTDAARAQLRAREFGFVFQDAALDPTRTVLDNVTEGAVYAGIPRRQAAERAASLMASIGVDVPATRRPGQVSGGQAQRIGLARALVNDPRVVLADEPTGNLDDANAAAVIETLRRAADQGAAVVCVSHDPRLLSACDEIRTL